MILRNINRIIEIILDYIFPPRDEEIILRSLDYINFDKKVKRSNNTEFTFIKSIYSYKDQLVKELIWQIKYKKNKNCLNIAGQALYNEIIKLNSEVILIPIPNSNKRRNELGYNQTELIVNSILDFDKNNKINKDFNIVYRKKNIEKQTFKNRNQRLTNTKNIFDLKDNNINKDFQIIIIDDVTTTGSTIKEVFELFTQNGFKNVFGLTIAH